MGTRFIATAEANAVPAYKDMIVDSEFDVIWSATCRWQQHRWAEHRRSGGTAILTGSQESLSEKG